MPPYLRSVMKIFTGGSSPSKRRRSDAGAQAKQTLPVAYLLVNDGSSVSSIQVRLKNHSSSSIFSRLKCDFLFIRKH